MINDIAKALENGVAISLFYDHLHDDYTTIATAYWGSMDFAIRYATKYKVTWTVNSHGMAKVGESESYVQGNPARALIFAVMKERGI